MKYLRLADAVRQGGFAPDKVAELLAAEIVVPRRTLEDERILSFEQLEDLRVAHVLLEELGVNVEGIEVILCMRRRQIALQRRLDDMMPTLREDPLYGTAADTRAPAALLLGAGA